MQYISLNRRIIPAENAMISVQDRGFRYGDGVFETIAVYSGVPYQFEWHMARLSGALAAIKLNFNANELPTLCRDLLHKNALQDGLLRLQITRGSGSRGYLPQTTCPTCVIETMPAPPPPPHPVSLWLSSYEKTSPAALPVRYKTCQGLNSTLARIEADEHGCFDALLLTQEGHISETSSGSIFWFKKNTLYTPALNCGALEGSMRANILRLSPYETQEIAADISALNEAEDVFIANTAYGLLPVKTVGQRNCGHHHDACTTLKTLVENDIRRYVADHKIHW